MQNYIIKCIIFCLSATLLVSTQAIAAEDSLISAFPLDHYSQQVSDWIHSDSSDNNTPLLSADSQKQRLTIYYNRYFGAASPWDGQHVNRIIQSEPGVIKNIEKDVIATFSNENKSAHEMGYGENYRTYDKSWITAIADNIDGAQFDNLSYQNTHRAIAIDNLHARALPTDDPHFYSHKLAGQGYPFDNLQMSTLWAGTPVYVIGMTHDRAWSLIISPEYIAWVKSNGLARASNTFVSQWQNAAKNKLAAITHTQTSITTDKGDFLFHAYVGAVFPAKQTIFGLQLMVPATNGEGDAVIKRAKVKNDEAAIMPLALTPSNLATIMQTLKNRPYGWGGMYFDNDCSAEMKSLFTPFGIWLPRNSSEQTSAGQVVDMTAASPEQRLSYLMHHGKRFLTLVYIGGHIVLYLGNYPNPNSSDHSEMAMTYQSMWGLSPKPATRRSIVGQSVFFPMLLQYPEDTTLTSHAAKSYFKLVYLDEIPVEAQTFMIKQINTKPQLNNDVA